MRVLNGSFVLFWHNPQSRYGTPVFSFASDVMCQSNVQYVPDIVETSVRKFRDRQAGQTNPGIFCLS